MSGDLPAFTMGDRKSTRLNSSHPSISYAVSCLKKKIPTIAYGHHEKLNGSGYPRHAAAPEIPIQTRMMTISDIFDALTASDRPYFFFVRLASARDIHSFPTRRSSD